MNPPRSLTIPRVLALVWLAGLAGFAIGIEWLRARPPAPPAPSGGIDLVGAGATFPFPVYRQWFADYRAATGVRINYFSVGSGEGIRLLLDEDVDFGASDRPLHAAERDRARCGPVELPMVVGAIAVVVHLPRIASVVRLDADALAAIYLGQVTRWDDPLLRALNPTLALPAAPILVVQRASTSGTSEVFFAYLAASARWKAARPGTDAAARPPVGEVAQGNEGVAAQVRAREGALGFVELTYAQQAQLATVALRNAAGAFVRPDAASLARATLAGASDPLAYPITATTNLVVDRALGDSTRAAHFIAFARWALRNGATAATALGYHPLSPPESRRQLARLDALTPGRCPTPQSP